MDLTQMYIDELITRYPNLKPIMDYIDAAYKILLHTFENDGKLLIAGNGGSSSDADHIVGELMKGFIKERKLNEELVQRLINYGGAEGKFLGEKLQQGLPTISLSNHNSLNTAFSNDVDGNLCFSQQVVGYGKKGDTLLCISTSGNSKNIVYSAIVAKALNMKVIGLTGNDGGTLKNYCDVNIIVPETETYKIQELHLPVYHCLCLMLEKKFYG